jgi:hypothetical protein
MALLFMLLAPTAISAQETAAKISVLTYHYDNFRTGQNTHETILTPSNVSSSMNPNQFGRLFARTLTTGDRIIGQPLYVPSLSIGGVTHNVVFVATDLDDVYAFDADSNTGTNAKPLWRTSLLASGEAPGGAHGGGVVSTPVIDRSTNTMYVEAKSVTSGATATPTYIDRLHALDILTGADKLSPVVVAGSVKRLDGTTVNFSDTAINQRNRSGLLLVKGTIYIGFASDGPDFHFGQYYGWLFAYDAVTLRRQGVFNTTLNATGNAGGGIWMSGAGLAADNNATPSVFLATGNGVFDSNSDFGDSIVKLALTTTATGPTLDLIDWFTPFDEATLRSKDLDLGSGGVLLLPDQTSTPSHLLVQAGKGGSSGQGPAAFAPIHLLDRDQLTINDQHFCNGCSSDTNILQEIPNAVGGMWAMPAYWNNKVYFWGSDDFLKVFTLSNSRLVKSSVTSSETYPLAANMSISANGTSNGILWTAEAGSTPSMILNAYDASNGGSPIYSSKDNQGRDDPGGDVHFIVPIVANGKVYLGGTQLSVYGQNPPDFTLSVTPASKTVTAGSSVTFTITITTINNFSGDPSLNVGGCPANAACTITGDPLGTGTTSTGTATLTVATQSTTPTGNHTITITATGGGITHNQSVVLDVI